MNPLEKYIYDDIYINIDEIPKDVIRNAFIYFGHKVDDDFVYGIKMVTTDYKDMYGINTYVSGKEYEYIDDLSDEGELKRFNSFSVYRSYVGIYSGGAGLWSSRYHRDTLDIINENKKTRLCIPIIVKYPIQEAIPEFYSIKGRKMIVVDTNPILNF